MSGRGRGKDDKSSVEGGVWGGQEVGKCGGGRVIRIEKLVNGFELCVYQVQHGFHDSSYLGKSRDQNVVVESMRGYANSRLPVDRNPEVQ